MPSKWIQHVMKTYRAKKKKNAGYKYSQAMKDAKATYKSSAAPKAKKKGRKKRAKKDQIEV